MSTQDLLCQNNALVDIYSFLLLAMPQFRLHGASVEVRASEGILNAQRRRGLWVLS